MKIRKIIIILLVLLVIILLGVAVKFITPKKIDPAHSGPTIIVEDLSELDEILEERKSAGIEEEPSIIINSLGHYKDTEVLKRIYGPDFEYRPEAFELNPNF
ncbi:MAG: hypothetical protein AAB617_00950 [Patescibacteria group bacterium]